MNNILEVLPVGTIVKLKDNFDGIINGILIGENDIVKYSIVWWVAGIRYSEYMSLNELGVLSSKRKTIGFVEELK